VLFEFALAGIPIMLLIISVMEISRGLWTYSTLWFAVTEASRLAIVHGSDCLPPNRCSLLVGSYAYLISGASPQLDPSQMNVTLSSTGGGATIQCYPLQSCISGGAYSATVFPLAGPGSDVIVKATYPFQSPLTMFFPGLTSPTTPIAVTLQATSQEPILF
jgi:hypothetical protein